MFISAETFKPMSAEVFEDKEAKVIMDIPPIIEEELAQTITESIERSGDFLSSFTTGNFFINLLLKGSMQ